MALGDKVIVVYDEGQRQPATKVVAVGSAGGTVGWNRFDGFVNVAEETRSGREVRRLAFREERVISVELEPRR